MNWIPAPLHPAVVHFPIVLIVLGTVAALVAVFWRGGQLPRLAALLLALGALGAWVALETGEDDGGLLEQGGPQLASLVDAHILWAKRTLAAAVLAAVLAASSALSERWPRLARAAAIATAVVALLSAVSVYQTGHRGGALVFQHGAGVALADNTSVASVSAMSAAKPAPSPKAQRTDADRD